MASSSSNVVGVHYRVGKKIGEGSFGVIFEGINLLNSQQVAIKFVRRHRRRRRGDSMGCTAPASGLAEARCVDQAYQMVNRSPGRATLHNCATSTEPTRFSLAAVSSYALSRPEMRY